MQQQLTIASNLLTQMPNSLELITEPLHVSHIVTTNLTQKTVRQASIARLPKQGNITRQTCVQIQNTQGHKNGQQMQMSLPHKFTKM